MASEDPPTYTVDDLARAVAVQLGVATPWMGAKEAANYLRCPVSRVRKLTSTGSMPVHRDGTRTLYHRDELDAFVRAGGGRSV